MSASASFFRIAVAASSSAVPAAASHFSAVALASAQAEGAAMRFFTASVSVLFVPYCIALALIIFGIAFIIIENWNKNRDSKKQKSSQITYKDALIIGFFQLLAAIFPGTSRSGATILGGLLIGLSRPNAAEFTFYLAIPTMLRCKFIKIS